MAFAVNTPMTWYQVRQLDATIALFGEREINATLCDINLHYDKNQCAASNCINGGSPLYNALIDKLTSFHLKCSLENHGIQEKFAYIWVWSNDFSVISQSMVWYDTKNKCISEAMRYQPSVDVCGNSPTPLLLLQSVCQCITAPPIHYVQPGVCNRCMSVWTPQNCSIRACCSNKIIYLPELFSYYENSDEEDSVSMHFLKGNVLPRDPYRDPLARECDE